MCVDDDDERTVDCGILVVDVGTRAESVRLRPKGSEEAKLLQSVKKST